MIYCFFFEKSCILPNASDIFFSVYIYTIWWPHFFLFKTWSHFLYSLSFCFVKKHFIFVTHCYFLLMILYLLLVCLPLKHNRIWKKNWEKFTHQPTPHRIHTDFSVGVDKCPYKMKWNKIERIKNWKKKKTLHIFFCIHINKEKEN